ncbi:MAG: 2-oxoglutarate dehydrogenase E1 component [Deltaproteobacteria bacterium]|nr:2-oxoglutarate dehydrogenase E1 component [Deltaproteobacteria bacterium]
MAHDFLTLLSGGNAQFLDDLYQRFLTHPQEVSPEWRSFFEGMNGGSSHDRLDISAGKKQVPAPGTLARPVEWLTGQVELDKQVGVSQLIGTYRRFGYTHAALDPLNRPSMPHLRIRPDLSLGGFGLGDEHLEASFAAGSLPGPAIRPLKDIVQRLREVYCGTLGVEYMYLRSDAEREWFRRRMEDPGEDTPLTTPQRKYLLEQITQAEMFERFLQTRFVGQKRFSLEGAETLIPMLNGLVQRAGEKGVEEIVLGMPHRGRLNVLANVMGKPLAHIFNEFHDQPQPSETTLAGDVKYHLGFSSDRTLEDPAGKTIHLSLSFNPSHLEAVNGVVEGNVRAKQDLRQDKERVRVLPVLIHGDAAFAGQGLVAEVLNLSELWGYATGGTVHIIVNNMIGFTTNARDSRSFSYPSDLSKMLLVPVIHVNGDDPEAAHRAVKMAVDYRQAFHRDVVIDMVCYRRLGHNEMDEPSFTQPLTYKRIGAHPTTLKVYAGQLAAEGTVSAAEAEALAAGYAQALEDSLTRSKQGTSKVRGTLAGRWEGMQKGDPERRIVETDVDRKNLEHITRALTTIPQGFTPHPRLMKLLEQRARMMTGEQPVDWGFAELLAYGSLLMDGYDVRLSGQDSQRGTFSHRHATLVDSATGGDFVPLGVLEGARGRFYVFNSPLSEAGVMSFEFGYSLASPGCLTLWEAQFGDFANGAQVIIDQFISGSEEKWERMSGLVLLLPHGFEGQGAEHSSGRVERFLQMCALDNMQVCIPTTPAQNFHLMRRQMHRKFRKPLVVFSPKSLLRLPAATSSIEDLIKGHFREVLWDKSPHEPGEISTVVFCSGKVFYDLEAAREKTQRKDTVVLRVEQLYPFPQVQVSAMVSRYAGAKRFVWCQEEPENMGGWRFVAPLIQPLLPDKTLEYAGRPAAAVPAGGSHHQHAVEQDKLVSQALG